MTTYQPPSEDLSIFNSSVFTTANEEGLTLSEAQSLFLGRTGNPTSTATSTSFTGGDLTIQGATFGLGGGAVFNNIAIGLRVLSNNTTGEKNVAVSSYEGLILNTSGNSNIAIGNRCLEKNTTASWNVAVGDSCLASNTTGDKNVAVGGFNTLSSTTTGFNNVAVGYKALTANTTGSRNVAIGFEAFQTGTIYNNSIALGASSVVAGNQAVAIGYLASASDNQIVLGTANETVLCKGTTANGSLTASRDIYVNSIRAGVGNFQSTTNTCFGNGALAATSTGINNTAFGKSALSLLTTGSGNTYFGVNAATAGFDFITGSNNTVVGFGNKNLGGTSISNNVYIGTALEGSGSSILIGNTITAAASTIIIGNSSSTNGGSSIIIGNGIAISQSKSISIGDSSDASGLRSICLGADTTASGTDSTAIGYGATASTANSIVLGTATETVYCVGTTTNGSLIASADIFVNGLVRAGVGKFKSGTDADVNTAFGRNALNATTSATNCSAFGNGAMALATSSPNCSAFGSGALAAITTSEFNSAFGKSALGALTSGLRNTAVGANAFSQLTTGSRNTAVGQGTGQGLTTAASDNTFLGYLAGGSVTTGSNNTFVGSTVSSGSSVSSSTSLGAFSGVSTFSNSTAIGGGTSAAIPGAICSAANQIMLGRATEFVECAGTDGTNGCLKLNGGLKLQTSYSTPTATMLGYQLTNTTGFAITSFTTATPTNISSAGIALTAGIWNIDYSIELLIATAIATVTAQTLFCSLTSGTTATYASDRISNSGITRILTTNTYNTTDTPCFSGSFNYYTSSATTVFPIFEISFTGGSTISGTGFYRATRVG